MGSPDIKKQLANYLWVEKYRPTTLNDMILPKSFRTYFNNLVKDKEIPNLLLVSSVPGVGKTSIAKALCYDLNATYKYINFSEKGGIDTLRNDIQKYASMKSIDGRPKIIIGDEADGTSLQFQQAIRGFLEEFKNSCRFIFTANYETKIIPAIKSRCQFFDFNMTESSISKEMIPQIINRLTGILSFESIEYNIEIIKKLVETFYPDIRRMISICQKYSIMNKNIDENIFKFDNVDEEFYSYILEKKFGQARKYLIEKNYNYSDLYKELNDNLVPKLEKSKQAKAILIIGEYMYRHSFVIDPEINAACCILEIMGIE